MSPLSDDIKPGDVLYWDSEPDVLWLVEKRHMSSFGHDGWDVICIDPGTLEPTHHSRSPRDDSSSDWFSAYGLNDLGEGFEIIGTYVEPDDWTTFEPSVILHSTDLDPDKETPCDVEHRNVR